MSDKIQFRGDYIRLTQAEWDHLLELAAATNSLAPTGTYAGEPSWRTLIKRIADGEYLLVPNPAPDGHPQHAEA